jgi:hypothetical protein
VSRYFLLQLLEQRPEEALSVDWSVVGMVKFQPGVQDVVIGILTRCRQGHTPVVQYADGKDQGPIVLEYCHLNVLPESLLVRRLLTSKPVDAAVRLAILLRYRGGQITSRHHGARFVRLDKKATATVHEIRKSLLQAYSWSSQNKCGMCHRETDRKTALCADADTLATSATTMLAEIDPHRKKKARIPLPRNKEGGAPSAPERKQRTKNKDKLEQHGDGQPQVPSTTRRV